MPKLSQKQITELSAYYSNFLRVIKEKTSLSQEELKEAIVKSTLLCELVNKNISLQISEEQHMFFNKILQFLKKQTELLQNGDFTSISHDMFAEFMQAMQNGLINNMSYELLRSGIGDKIKAVYNDEEDFIELWNAFSDPEKVQIAVGMTITAIGAGIMIAAFAISLSSPPAGMLMLAGICITVGVELCQKVLTKHKDKPKANLLSSLLDQLASCSKGLINNFTTSAPKSTLQAFLPTFKEVETVSPSVHKSQEIETQVQIPTLTNWQDTYKNLRQYIISNQEWKIRLPSTLSKEKIPHNFTIEPATGSEQHKKANQIQIQYDPHERSTRFHIKTATPTNNTILQMLVNAQKCGDILTLNGTPELLIKAIDIAYQKHIPIQIPESSMQQLQAKAGNDPTYQIMLDKLELIRPGKQRLF